MQQGDVGSSSQSKEPPAPVIDKRIPGILEAKDPTRIAVFVRTRSPYASLSGDEVVPQACSTLGIGPAKSRAKLMTTWKLERLTIFTFDVWYDDYDWATAHHGDVDLPVLLVDYGKRFSSVKVAGSEFRADVHHFVAQQHESHGWNAKPPYFQDQTGPTVPTYYRPRSMKVLGEDGVSRRAVKTPPPGSTSAAPYPLPDLQRGPRS